MQDIKYMQIESLSSINSFYPSAASETFSFSLSLIDSMFLQVSIYYSSVLGGTTDQSEVDSQY